MRPLALSLLAAATLLVGPASASPPGKPRDCGAISFAGTQTHVVVLQGVRCGAAKKVARRFDRRGVGGTGAWRCAYAHAPFRKVLGSKVGFSCGKGGTSGDLSQWPRAFVGTL
ncbi:MAG TPA: hypothetical protein VIL49_16420 [Capillimicrobium sp.]|jgi:hypothetical protein